MNAVPAAPLGSVFQPLKVYPVLAGAAGRVTVPPLTTALVFGLACESPPFLSKVTILGTWVVQRLPKQKSMT